MRFKTITLFLWIFLIASAAIAGEEHRTRIEIVFDDDTSGGQSFVFDSKDSEIRYIDGSDLDVDADSQVHGRHEVRIIRKEFDETN